MVNVSFLLVWLLAFCALAIIAAEHVDGLNPGVVHATISNVTYYGGSVLSGGINLYVIYCGSSWTVSTKGGITSFLTSLGSSSSDIAEPRLSQWWSILTQYDGPPGSFVSSNVTYKGSYDFPSSLLPSILSISDTIVGSLIIDYSISSRSFPADSNGIYIILTGSDVVVTDACTCGTYWNYTYDSRFYIKGTWLHDASDECPDACFPYQTILPPSGNVVTDGVIYLMSLGISTVAVDPLSTGWKTTDASPFYEICGYGSVQINQTSGGSYNIYGVNNQTYLVPQLYDRVASQCTLTPVALISTPPSPSPLLSPPSNSSTLSPPPSPPPSPTSPPPESKGSSIVIIIGAISGVMAGVLISAISFVFFCFCRRQRKGPIAAPARQEPHSGSVRTGSIIDVGDGHYTRQFTLEEVRAATDSFSEEKLLGQGGFGSVYVGSFAQGGDWAVKRAHNRLTSDEISVFESEVKLIAKVSHRNVVGLKGFCDEDGEQILVYDLVSNGNLRQHIQRDEKIGGHVLSLHRRIKIAIGAAKGLEYLHGFEGSPIIHRDVKTENILLDENFIPKVADFGLLKAMDDAATHVSADIVGTYGYLDPEYISTKRVTTKSDVYSFGIVLLELVTGRKTTVLSSNEGLDNRTYENINVWVKNALNKGGVGKVVDPFISSNYSVEAIKKLIELAQWCTKYESKMRPTMREVVSTLEQIEKLDVESGESSVASGSVVGTSTVGTYDNSINSVLDTSSSYDFAYPGQSGVIEAPVSFAPRGR